MPKLDEQQYVATGGIRCPACESAAGVEGGEINVDAGIAWQSCSCAECGASWNDNYQLTGYSNLDEGK